MEYNNVIFQRHLRGHGGVRRDVAVVMVVNLPNSVKLRKWERTCIPIVQILNLNRYLLQNTALEKEKNVAIMYY
jgi:hypothetical protein